MTSLVAPTQITMSSEAENPNNWKRNPIPVATLPPGKYYIGDICYPLGEHIFYHRVFGEEGYGDGHYYCSKTNSNIVVAGTAYGDGEYKGSDGFGYGVDAGIIGIVSADLFDVSTMYGGKMWDFPKGVHVNFGSGQFCFESSDGQWLQIDTAGNNEYEEDEEDEDNN